MPIPIYILSTSMVSPQSSFEQLLSQPAVYTGDKMRCIEPDYTKYVDAKLIRRMSRIIKMGVAAAMESLQQAGLNNPDAIITGTAYGCLADTDAFLTRMVEFKEELLSPTAFIQSTHNTVAAQIALMLQCHNYNNTYVHRGASFESALLDAVSLINEGDAATVLVGAADEIIEKSHTILQRFGIYKENSNSAALLNSRTTGTMAGEGAAFFVLSSNKEHAIARLDAFASFYKPALTVKEVVQEFLTANNLPANDADLVVVGNNGDVKTDTHYAEIARDLFKDNKLVGYKNYCGEYPTSSAFALWMAVKMIERGKAAGIEGAPKKILIYNNYKLKYPTLYLVSAC